MKEFKNADEIVSKVMGQLMTVFDLILPNYTDYINKDNTLEIHMNHKKIREDNLKHTQVAMLGSYCTTKIIELELKKL